MLAELRRPVHGGYPGDVPESPRIDRHRCAMCGLRTEHATLRPVAAPGWPCVCVRCGNVIDERNRHLGEAVAGIGPLMTRSTSLVFYR